jgi:hypothetical protein
MKEGAWGWGFSLGAEGPIRISDITTNGTAGCYVFRPFPECQVVGLGAVYNFLTGPPDGVGPQTEENVGAASSVILKWDGVVRLPNQGPSVVCKVRVTGVFPANLGEVSTGRVFFTTKAVGANSTYPPAVLATGSPITEVEGDPPLEVEECVFHLKASDVGAFIRCDANDDGGVSLSDAVWILNELFLGGAATRCRPAADCDGNGAREVSDAVYALSHLFLGGPEPPPPFRFCDRIDVPVEECPPGATACP